MFEGFALDVFNWLQEIEEDKAAAIIAEGEIVGFYCDTAFAVSGEDEWDIYDVQIRVPGRYYKALDEKYSQEKSVIEKVVSEVAAQERMFVQGMTWTLKLGSRIKRPETVELEKKILNELALIAASRGGVIAREVQIALREYANGNYTASLKVFYPTIEQIMNQLLIKHGENLSSFRGIYDKKKKLVELGCITEELGESFELNKPRNGVLHGSFSPTNDAYSYPMNLSAMIFLVEIIKAS